MLRSLLNSISQKLNDPDLIEKVKIANEDIETTIKKLSQSVKFIDFFVHDIFDFSVLRKEDEEFTKDKQFFDIRDAVKEIVEIQEDKVEMKSLNVHTEFKNFPNGLEGETGNFVVKTDQKRFQQVLLNLYSNAIKFTERGGEIKITVELQTSEEKGQMLHVSVKDNGMGIKQEDQTRLFRSFSSLKNPRREIDTKGIGLGLVICKMIVEKFNGKIGFKTTYEKGTTFHFQFETTSCSCKKELKAIKVP